MRTRAYGRHLCLWEMAARSGSGFASHRAATRCGGMCKAGIEHGCDAANQEFRAVADRKPIVGHRHGAVAMRLSIRPTLFCYRQVFRYAQIGRKFI